MSPTAGGKGTETRTLRAAGLSARRPTGVYVVSDLQIHPQSTPDISSKRRLFLFSCCLSNCQMKIYAKIPMEFKTAGIARWFIAVSMISGGAFSQSSMALRAPVRYPLRFGCSPGAFFAGKAEASRRRACTGACVLGYPILGPQQASLRFSYRRSVAPAQDVRLTRTRSRYAGEPLADPVMRPRLLTAKPQSSPSRIFGVITVPRGRSFL